MSLKDTIASTRRQLLDNGYSPLPNRDKRCFLPGWPKVSIDEDTLKRWSRMRDATATGLRVENGLCVIDIDIDHRVIEDVAEAMLSVLPEDLHPERLERSGKGHKFAWYCRTNDLFARLHTRAWLAPGETEDDGGHRVEIFGGGSPRQFGSFGPHTVDDDGEVKVMYKWAEESPLDVPLNALDVLTKDQLFAMLDAAEAELKVQGFTPIKRTTRGEGVPRREYDLTEDMQFELLDGDTVSLSELQAMVKDGYRGNCSASWLDGPIAKNRHRCLISASGSGHVTVWESAAGVTHMAQAIKPTDHASQVDRIAEKIRERQDARRSRLSDGDDHISGAAKLLVSYAFMPTSNKPIVPLWSKRDDEGMTLNNFRTKNQPYCGVEIGPRGGETRINPVDVWLSNVNRIEVAGQRMRPDRERPTYEEDDGETYINTYRPPDLGAADGGDAEGGVALLEQLLPRPREREWFRKWLAYKWLNPHVPGPAVIMVARDFGTGRGTFGSLLKRLFGQRYVVNVPFKIFAGLSTQSQYTSWGLGRLFAIVNESSAVNDGGHKSEYKTKHEVYEFLKEVVEPAPHEKHYIIKGEGAVDAMSSTSHLIMTNNIDAIPLPDDDRRFAVLTNGDKRDPEFWKFFHDWMGKQANLAAFAQWLEATDLASYDPFAVPLMTGAKADMTALNKSPLDMLLAEALSDMKGYFTTEHVLRHMSEAEMRTKYDLPDGWRSIATKEVRRKAYAVCSANERKVAPMVNGRRYEVFHTDRQIAEQAHTAAEVRKHLAENGNVFGNSENGFGGNRLQKAALRLVKNKDED